MMSSNGFVAIGDRIFPDEVAVKRLGSPAISIDGSEQMIRSGSPISCVSSTLQEEYDELLKYALVVPACNSTKTFHPPFPEVGLTVTPSIPLSTAFMDAVSGADSKQQFAAAANLSSATDAAESAMDKIKSQEGVPQQPTALVTTAELSESNVDMDLECGKDYFYTVTVDQDVSQMDALMDEWTAELKRKVLTEFSQTKIRILENHRHQMMKQKDVYNVDVRRQVDETESLKELLHTYEQSIKRKDQVITNLTASLQSHRNKIDMQRSFCEWKIRHNDTKREGFASKLAYCHYHRTLQRKVWEAWHSLVETRWRQRVEKACQAKAQEVCIKLTNDYETKLASLNEALESARTEVQHLHRERSQYEETMKKAFMRGVCALNLEAMTMFHEGDRGLDLKTKKTDDQTDDENLLVRSSTTIPQEFVYCSDPAPGPPQPRIVTRHAANWSSTVASTRQPSAVHSKIGIDSSKPKVVAQSAKAISTKVTARQAEVQCVTGLASASGCFCVAPPMTSVIVERHLPVTKQTIGQATATKYPRSSSTTA